MGGWYIELFQAHYQGEGVVTLAMFHHIIYVYHLLSKLCIKQSMKLLYKLVHLINRKSRTSGTNIHSVKK